MAELVFEKLHGFVKTRLTMTRPGADEAVYLMEKIVEGELMDRFALRPAAEGPASNLRIPYDAIENQLVQQCLHGRQECGLFVHCTARPSWNCRAPSRRPELNGLFSELSNMRPDVAEFIRAELTDMRATALGGSRCIAGQASLAEKVVLQGNYSPDRCILPGDFCTARVHVCHQSEELEQQNERISNISCILRTRGVEDEGT
jgi:hypothetical protein